MFELMSEQKCTKCQRREREREREREKKTFEY